MEYFFFGYIKHNFNIRTYYCSESTCCKSPSAMEEVTDFHTGWHIQKAAEIGANYFCGLLCVVCTQNTEKYSYELPKTSSKKQTKGEIEDRQCGGGGGEEQGDAGEGGSEQAHMPVELSKKILKVVPK